jgi:hypothetical protein
MRLAKVIRLTSLSTYYRLGTQWMFVSEWIHEIFCLIRASLGQIWNILLHTIKVNIIILFVLFIFFFGTFERKMLYALCTFQLLCLQRKPVHILDYTDVNDFELLESVTLSCHLWVLSALPQYGCAITIQYRSVKKYYIYIYY